MGDGTTIDWAANADGSPGSTWNPIVGCSIASPGCAKCYAMRAAGHARLAGGAKYAGLTEPSKAGPVWNGQVRLWEPEISKPGRKTKPTTFFVNSMGDLFHEAVPTAWIDRVFDAMEANRRHTYIILTKRAARQRDYVNARWIARVPPPHIWLGVSVEDQPRAEERLPALVLTRAAVRLVSAEPLIKPIWIREWLPLVSWIIAGGESGPDARPVHPDWIRQLRDQCAEARVPFWFKQWGAWAPCSANAGEWPTDEAKFCRLRLDGRRGPEGWPMQLVGKKHAGDVLDGATHKARPPIPSLERKAA